MPIHITPEVEEQGKPEYTEFVPVHRKTMERMQMAWSNALHLPTEAGKVALLMTQEERSAS